MARYEDLPYRTCVGVMLINMKGLVFIGRRAGGIEHVDDAHVWQMPQGGVDPGEDTWDAAKRELYEETSVRSVERLGEVPDWLVYDIPRTVAGRAWKGRYRGQRQKMVRGPVHRQGQRDQCRKARRRPQGRVRELALGADEEPDRFDHPVQAPGL
ncbi:8-oxo-dGTP pyrophosphatase MutT (NUDIX family) [Bradyrhizobium sp. i1.7.7]